MCDYRHMKTKVLKTIKQWFNKVVGVFPTALPRGMTEWEQWVSSVISTYDLPDNDSFRFSLAVMVLHLDSTSDVKPKYYFAKAIRKAMSNQVVSQVIQDAKAKQEAAVKAAKQQAEATTTEVASLEPQK